MTRALSVRTRAALAVVLLVGFYALALAVAGGLLFIPYAEIRYAERLEGRLAIFCVVGAFLILKGIAPRIDRFEAPGPRLTKEAHPELFALIDGVARETGQAPPAEVYLVSDVNAWVTERGGVMGVGSRRVMGIGLPLLEALTVDELRAVVAHEFGHFVGGDTRLGPWVYKTRAAIERTLANLHGHSAMLSKPFRWYGLGFLRVTHAVSRSQEFVADAVAARTAGLDAARGALRRISAAAAAYGPYWRSELGPALERGYRPPLASGFGQFMRAPSVAPRLAEVVEEELREAKPDPYDTHPCLRDRLAALDALRSTTHVAKRGAREDTRPALALLRDVDAVEAALIATLAPKDAKPLAPVTWEDAPAIVLPAGWREAAAEHAAGLAGLTPELLPALAGTPGALAVRLRLAPSTAHATEEIRLRAEVAVSAALALALLERTQVARLHAPPGEPVSFVAAGAAPDGGDLVVQPFSVCPSLAEGRLTAEEWGRQCARLGIAGRDLGGVGG